MNKKLLTALASLLLVASNVWAWDEPVAPAKPTQAGEFVAGHTYFIRNVEGNQYMTGSNSWSTQSSLTINGINDEYSPAIAFLINDTTITFNGAPVSGYYIRLNGSYTVNGNNGPRTFTDTFLFRDSENSAFIDYNNQGKGVVWSITEAGNGYYHIQTAEGDPAYPNAAEQYAGWSSEEGAIEADEDNGQLISGSTVVNYGMTGDGEYDNIDWEFIPADEYLATAKTYPARRSLYETLLRADEYNVDATEAGAVYNNPDATVEELEAANAALKAIVDRKYYEDRWEGASEDNPLDVTDDCLVNPSFDTGNIEGWNNTFKSGVNATNCGYMGASYPREGVEAGANIDGFIEAWANCWADSQAKLGDAELSQTIIGVPMGRYKLEVDAIAVAQVQGSWNPVKGVYLFIKSGRFEEKVSLHTDNEKPEHFEVEFLNEGVADELTFGLKTENCNANWIAADNFRITYYGALTESIERTMLRNALTTYGEPSSDECNAAIYEAWENALAEAETMVDDNSATNEQCLEQLETLKAAYEAVEASVLDYIELEAVYEKTEALAQQLEEEHIEWIDLVEEIGALVDEISDALSNYTADHAFLESVRDKAINRLREYIASGDKIKEGDDLTILLENADFQTPGNAKTDVPGWTTVSGEITELSKDFGDIEVYCKHANIQQTLQNMPMGAYDITVQGFVRGNNDKVQLYAGDSKTSFKNVMDEYSEELSFGTEEERDARIEETGNPWPFDNSSELEDGTTVYRPHSMQGAAAAFAKNNPHTGEPFYTNHCRIVHTKAGDLTIGINVDFTSGDPEVWAIWDNFRIKYAGNEAAMYADEIRNRQNTLNKLLESEDAFITQEGETRANKAIEDGDEALENNSIEDCIAAMQELEDATEYIKAAKALADSLSNLANTYLDYRVPLVDSDDDEYYSMLEEATYPMAENYASNEEIIETINRILEGWAGYVLYNEKDTATPDDPAEVTQIIYNPDFIDPITYEDSNSGWTIVLDAGATNCSEGALECYDNETFNVSQQLIGLAPGYYTVSVDAFYRAGLPNAYTDSLTNVRNARLYAYTQAGNYETAICNAIDGGQALKENIGAESRVIIGDEIDLYIPNNIAAAKQYLDLGYYPNKRDFCVGQDGKATIGIRKDEHITGDWTICSTWELYYLGTTAPDAIQDVEATPVRLGDSNVYDLSGRRISRPARGLYIVDGHKVLIK